MKLFGLYDYQADAVAKMKNGCILCGGVGSGKSRTSIAYFLTQQEGVILNDEDVIPSKKPIQNLFIITTARKRDKLDWEADLMPYMLSSKFNAHKNKVVIDSWNNIKKYKMIKNAFFIFDEQKVSGKGAWVKTFLYITRFNNWVLLSATPGDNWEDYAPVFIANGFFRNRTEFETDHVIKTYYGGYPEIKGFMGEKKLERLRDSLLVNIDVPYVRERVYERIQCGYDREQYLNIVKLHWNPFTDSPIETAAEFCQALRRCVNSNKTRQDELLKLLKDIPKAIIFYSYDYELDILKGLDYIPGTLVAEWNGHEHQDIPTNDRWVYLVQYSACEGWNCITTNVIIFFSQQYSWKVFEQACGRIDRTTSPFNILYYYSLTSKSPIDKAIYRALVDKKLFNEKGFSKFAKKVYTCPKKELT